MNTARAPRALAHQPVPFTRCHVPAFGLARNLNQVTAAAPSRGAHCVSFSAAALSDLVTRPGSGLAVTPGPHHSLNQLETTASSPSSVHAPRWSENAVHHVGAQSCSGCRTDTRMASVPRPAISTRALQRSNIIVLHPVVSLALCGPIEGARECGPWGPRSVLQTDAIVIRKSACPPHAAEAQTRGTHVCLPACSSAHVAGRARHVAVARRRCHVLSAAPATPVATPGTCLATAPCQHVFAELEA